MKGQLKAAGITSRVSEPMMKLLLSSGSMVKVDEMIEELQDSDWEAHMQHRIYEATLTDNGSQSITLEAPAAAPVHQMLGMVDKLMSRM